LANNSAERNRRQALRTAQLEKRLSEALGETVWQQTGLGASSALDALQRQISHLEQQVVDLGRQLADRTDELEAARATSRELMAQLNRRAPS
jgi:ABC-type transporter Mla subunit MlaD